MPFRPDIENLSQQQTVPWEEQNEPKPTETQNNTMYSRKAKQKNNETKGSDKINRIFVRLRKRGKKDRNQKCH